jgi:hypothetical protein
MLTQLCRNVAEDAVKHVDFRESPPSGKALASMLHRLPQLTALTLHKGTPKAFAALAKELLSPTAALTRLELCAMQPSSSSVADLASALALHTSLAHLQLSSCCIGTVGILDMVQMLEVNSVLQRMDLSRNCSVPGMLGLQRSAMAKQSIWDALASNSTLEHLDLRESQLEDVEASALATALQRNTCELHSAASSAALVCCLSVDVLSDLWPQDAQLTCNKPYTPRCTCIKLCRLAEPQFGFQWADVAQLRCHCYNGGKEPHAAVLIA